MTRNAIRFCAEALRLAKAYDDSNPDVGFGPSVETILDRVCSGAGVRLTAAEKSQVLKLHEARKRGG